MNKKVVLRKWLEYTLIIVNIFCIIILASECKDMTLFISKGIISMIIFLFNGVILEVYTK